MMSSGVLPSATGSAGCPRTAGLEADDAVLAQQRVGVADHAGHGNDCRGHRRDRGRRGHLHRRDAKAHLFGRGADDVFYDGVVARADPLIDQWKRETAKKEEEND
jgi:hypothetical protein